jgi:hypothetical protein
MVGLKHTEILLKVALSTIIPPQSQDVLSYTCVLIRPWSKLYVCINLMVVKRIHAFLISRWANVCIHVEKHVRPSWYSSTSMHTLSHSEIDTHICVRPSWYLYAYIRQTIVIFIRALISRWFNLYMCFNLTMVWLINMLQSHDGLTFSCVWMSRRLNDTHVYA